MKIRIAFLVALSFATFGKKFNVGDRILTENFYKRNYDVLFGKKEYTLQKFFKREVYDLWFFKKNSVLTNISKLGERFPDKIIMPLVYWKTIDPNVKNLTTTIKFLYLSKLLSVRDYLDDPHSKHKEDVKKLLQNSLNIPDVKEDEYYWIASKILFPRARKMAREGSLKKVTRCLLDDEFLALSFKKTAGDFTPYTLSFLGIIPGNEVELIGQNEVSAKRINWVNDRVIFAGGKLDFEVPYMRMPSENEQGNVIFSDPIFSRIREMIDRAKDSIFIDIFLFGGTMGGTLSKYLIDKTLEKRKVNKNFKVLLLHDYATNYNMKNEMMPVFNYIKNRIDNEKDVRESVFLMQANIQRHPPGIPFGITDLFPKTKEFFKIIESRNTYYESKIDHSKVIVIDANSDSPEAYFGSKNWSDHSGSYYYDDAIWVKGPAAALVQNSYYDDVAAALTLDKSEQEWFFFKEAGFDNKRYLKNRKEILNWFRVKKVFYPHIGDDSMRIAEANVDGKIKNARNIIIDMIAKAQDHIYMEQLFLYDSYVVDALIKKKIQLKDKLKVFVLMDHNYNFGLNGLPNTLFLKEMKNYGIEVRFRKTMGVTAIFPNGEGQTYHQENHRKIMSVDGKYLLGGSSNINPDTLQGSFREFGGQIFSKKVISQFEKRFEDAWYDVDQLTFNEIENFQATVGGKKLGIGFSRFINDLGSLLYRSKDLIENRH